MTTLCLITNTNISYNPRLVKEADALHEAGFSVHVVYVCPSAERGRLDDGLMETRGWTRHPIRADRTSPASTARWLWSGLRQKIARPLAAAGMDAAIPPAYSRYLPELTARATELDADFYIAHNLQALPAALRAAWATGAIIGFDAEDFHRGQFYPDEHPQERHLTEILEERLIPACDYRTAASTGIAKAYVDLLDIPPPAVVLNAFPLSERAGRTPPDELVNETPEGDVISLYWYSQTIGPNRGLKMALNAFASLPDTVHLSLRGTWSPSFREPFMRMAHDLGVTHRLHILPPTPPEQLVERAAQHDIGLALEQPTKKNWDLCVSNKILVYLLAGISVVATDTIGQKSIADEAPDAVFSFPYNDEASLTRTARSLVDDRDILRNAKAASRKAGETRFNWNIEKQTLLQAVCQVLRKNGHSVPEDAAPSPPMTA